MEAHECPQAGLPLTTQYLRNHVFGESGILENGPRRPKVIFAVITVASFLALVPMNIRHTAYALGFCSAVFTSIFYVLLEDLTSQASRREVSNDQVNIANVANGPLANVALGAAIGSF